MPQLPSYHQWYYSRAKTLLFLASIGIVFGVLGVFVGTDYKFSFLIATLCLVAAAISRRIEIKQMAKQPPQNKK
jgi:hypothetical protein